MDDYASQGKEYCRTRIRQICKGYSYARGNGKRAGLNILTLGENHFAGEKPLAYWAKEILVVEKDTHSFDIKHASLRQLQKYPQYNCLRLHKEPVDIRDYMLSCHRRFDIVNLDLCIGFNADCLEILLSSLQVLDPKGSALFLTAAKNGVEARHTRHRGVGMSVLEYSDLVESVLNRQGWRVDLVDGLPISYSTRKYIRMMCFGWSTRKEDLMASAKLTQREKDALISLRLNNVAAPLVAKAFKVSTGTVAAFVANHTRKK